MAAFLMAFGGADRVGASVLIVGGALAIAGSRSMAKGQNRINKIAGRITRNPWGSATPRLFIIWGTGILILGIVWLFGS